MKKIFSAHISKQSFDYLVTQLGLESEIQLSRYCTAALKDLLECVEPQACAQEISNFDLDWSEPLDSGRIVVSSSKCEREAINLAAATLSVSPNQICSVLIDWSIKQNIEEVARVSRNLPALNKEISLTLNVAQKETLSWLVSNGWNKPEEAPNKIFYAELGTGSGKTLLALSAAKIAAKEGRRTWIAVPSLGVQKQFIGEYTKRFGRHSGLVMSLVSGRREFVSESRLLTLIEDDGKSKGGKDWTKQALQWVDRLADKPQGADRRRWLMGSLLEHVPSFPFADNDVCITTECPADDSGVLAYEDQFNLADRADIVVMTHHYLALETMARVRAGVIGLSKDENAKSLVSTLYAASRSIGTAGQKLTHSELLSLIDQKNQIFASLFDVNEVGRMVLPNRLIIDEAHLLEENFSSANTIRISVRRLPTLFSRVMKAKGIKPAEGAPTPSKIFDQLSSLCSRMASSHMPEAGAKVFLNWGNPPAKDRLVVSCAEDLATVMTSFSISGTHEEAQSLRRSQYAFKKMLSAARFNIALFSNSPIRQYPQILFGSANHTSDFRMLFSALGIESTLLLSATIFLPSIGGAWSARRFISGLGLRPEETTGMRAPAQTWLTEPVTLYMPPKPSDISREFGAGHVVLKPSNDAKESDAWIKDLVTFCKWSTSTAAGGTLVLLTSYESAAKLASSLSKAIPGIASRLLVSEPKVGRRPSELKAQFIDIYHSGEKPIWIAVGNCWTGLNLTDESIEPEKDNLVTDLIIPRTPYALNQSISAAAKGLTAARHIQALEEAGMTLKQGIGRLVRRPGIPHNRRLFFLDTRIYEKGKKPLLNMSCALFSAYQKAGHLPRGLIKEMVGPTIKRSGQKYDVRAVLITKNDAVTRSKEPPPVNLVKKQVEIVKKTFGGKKKNIQQI